METFIFDLQMFAEDSDGASEKVSIGETVDDAEEQSLPEELAGLSEDVAREVLAEYEGEEPTEEDETEDAEADSDNKQYEVSNQRIPYSRFKEVNDNAKELEKQLKAYREKFGSLDGGQQSNLAQATVPPPTQEVSMTSPPQEQITPEVVEQINQAIVQEAMAMTGFSQEDVDDLEYLDDNDPRHAQWATAQQMARSKVYGIVQQVQVQRQREVQRIMQEHQASVADYNAFAQKEMAEPNYNQVLAFATNDYFESLPATEQGVVASAYNRVERNLASPQDIMTVKRYFTDAKRAFHEGARETPAPSKRKEQTEVFPRAGEVRGAIDTSSVTAAQLEKMLQENEFSSLPKEYQDMLLGG